ncbi:hypothetical protein [Chondromyces crocatus]|uniref:PBS lyase n=1 Tax=Chondromyces crocatus TaxID=52 RepID=A0A0K1EMW6_CHOCO|nr:hypothetical protein [Chondromyces crocatus]AKT42166.1 uncharacterized protein CMC5_063890 [Chondromyces crocatus]
MEPAAPRRGLEAPDNDPKIVAELEKVLACPWNEEEGFRTTSPEGEWVECAAFDAWNDNHDLLGDDSDKGALTLLNLAEDEDEKVRYLALDKMPARAHLFKDKVASERILTLAENETSERVAGPLGYAVGWIRVDKTDLLPRIKKLVETTKIPEMRTRVYGTLLRTNSSSREVFDYYLASLKNDDPKLRYTVLLSLQGGKEFASDTCNELTRLLEDPDGSVLGLAAQRLGYGDPCEAKFDALLSYAKKRAEAGGVKEFLLANALDNGCTRIQLSDAQRKEAESIARSLASGKNDDLVRESALGAVMSCNPKGGPAFVKGFSKDKSDFVKRGAERLLKKASAK